jgi:hypothetical protein
MSIGAVEQPVLEQVTLALEKIFDAIQFLQHLIGI